MRIMLLLSIQLIHKETLPVLLMVMSWNRRQRQIQIQIGQIRWQPQRTKIQVKDKLEVFDTGTEK